METVDCFGRARTRQSGDKKNHRACQKLPQGGEKGIGTRERSWCHRNPPEIEDLAGGNGGATSSGTGMGNLVVLLLGFFGANNTDVEGLK